MFDLTNLPLLSDKLFFIKHLTGNYLTYALGLHFLLILIFFVLNMREIINQFKNTRKKTLILLLLIFLLGIFLRYDFKGCESLDRLSWEYIFTAEEMIKNQTISDLWHPRGYSFILVVLFLIFGMYYNIVLYYNIFISGFLTILIFLLSYVLFKNENVGLFSALLFSLLPTSIFYTQYLSSNITSVFFVTLSVLIFFISLRVDKPRLYYLATLLFTYTLHVRIDNSMFMILIFFGILYYAYKRKIDLKNLRLPAILFVILLIPVSYFYLHGDILFGSYNDPSHDKMPHTFSLSYLRSNLTYYFSRLFVSRHYPPILFFFFLLPLIFIKKDYEIIFPIIWIIVFFLFYGTYWYSRTNDPDLYQLLLHPPMVMLMGYGLGKVKNIVESSLKIKSSLSKTVLFILVIVFILWSFFFYSKEFYKQERCVFCESKSILKITKELREDSCLIVEDTGYEYTPKPFVGIVRFLAPRLKVTTVIEECKNKMYYLEINGDQFKRVFGHSNKTLDIIKKGGYELNLVRKIDNECGFARIYKINE